MKITSQRNGASLTLVLEGRLDTSTSPQLSETLKESLCDQDIKECVLELSGLVYISSAGLRVLLSLHKQMLAAGGTFLLRNVQPGPMDILEMTNFTEFLTIQKTP